MAIEVEVVGTIYLNLIKLAHAKRLSLARNQHLGIDLGRIELGAPNEIVTLDPVDDGGEDVAHLLLLHSRTDALLKAHEFAETGLLDSLRDIISQMGGTPGTLLLAVGESSQSLKTDTANKLQKLLIVLLGLTGETNHESGAQMDAWHLGADGLDEVVGLLTGDMAMHGRKHGIGNMLEGQIEVFADIGPIAHHRQELHGEIGGIGIMEADPLDPLDIGDTLDELRQSATAIEVETIIGEFLSDDLELLHPHRDESTDLGEDLFHRSALMVAGDERDGAIGTMAVATLGDLEIGIVGRGGETSLAAMAGLEGMPQIREELGPVELAIELINLGNLGSKLRKITLGEASHDIKTPEPALLLALSHRENHLDALLLGIPDEATGIDDGNLALGIVAIMGHTVTAELKLPNEALAIDQVLAATQSDDINRVCFHRMMDPC